jgi:hypothetical protein
MIREARLTTGRVLEKIDKQCYHKTSLIKAFFSIVDIDPKSLPEEIRWELKRQLTKSLTCIEGLCYEIGLNYSSFPIKSPLFRCAQFVTLIDKSLYGYGIDPCSLEDKLELYKAFELYDIYLKHPKSFYTSKNQSKNKIAIRELLKKADPFVLEMATKLHNGEELDKETRDRILDIIEKDITFYRELYVRVTGDKELATKDELLKWFGKRNSATL